jgi:hypothetical protein
MTLASFLERLFSVLTTQGAPRWEELAFHVRGPNSEIDKEGRLRIARGTLLSLDAAERTFSTLMQQGYPWLNLSCVGLLDRALIVLIEHPHLDPQHRSPRTSVNVSGASEIVVSHGWDAAYAVSLG